ncbi:hypothetical protein AGABI2DRAFT_146559 [Agaricus bisporus var. bisporus H97]|uniref:hypothetical protein n=1 Tax=Agaricus bisporus var. bisporus (strain H97 / ATCC MYA-4626 / FGSC 10389) TaxID=936046 RepID=UPI00029F6858|nr:hypothetical protein AGABI2DRAFT_146559 [Agaricus bisporus var. bisporus H97]EKV42522.1 hypothetical protein AGABI2DRAFT_146559 [Agaricus bisporus var. bisporus H97]
MGDVKDSQQYSHGTFVRDTEGENKEMEWRRTPASTPRMTTVTPLGQQSPDISEIQVPLGTSRDLPNLEIPGVPSLDKPVSGPNDIYVPLLAARMNTRKLENRENVTDSAVLNHWMILSRKICRILMLWSDVTLVWDFYARATLLFMIASHCQKFCDNSRVVNPEIYQKQKSIFKQKLQSTHLGNISKPTVVLDQCGRIVVWYLPDLMSKDQLDYLLSVTKPIIPHLKKPKPKDKASWRNSSSVETFSVGWLPQGHAYDPNATLAISRSIQDDTSGNIKTWITKMEPISNFSNILLSFTHPPLHEATVTDKTVAMFTTPSKILL